MEFVSIEVFMLMRKVVKQGALILGWLWVHVCTKLTQIDLKPDRLAANESP